jgi:hypothetical protein
MLLSAEIRWFWEGSCPEALEAWFETGSPPPGGGSERVDVYLRDRQPQAELGLKQRGTKPGVEVKGLIATLPAGDSPPPFAGPLELWCKWTSRSLDLGGHPILVTRKTRRLRRLDMARDPPEEIPLARDENPEDGRPLPDDGCNIELTRIGLEGGRSHWWTLAFEAFGSLDRVEGSLRRALAVMATRHPPPLGPARRLSYPAWLATLVAT